VLVLGTPPYHTTRVCKGRTTRTGSGTRVWPSLQAGWHLHGCSIYHAALNKGSFPTFAPLLPEKSCAILPAAHTRCTTKKYPTRVGSGLDTLPRVRACEFDSSFWYLDGFQRVMTE
jgi:hypothetical protein